MSWILKNFSIYTSSLPKYFLASDFAVAKRDSNSCSLLTIFIPFPPPPPDALIKIGKPIFLQRSLACLISFTPPSEPSITGNPFSLAIFLLGSYHPSF